jgi:hypothetical protein
MCIIFRPISPTTPSTPCTPVTYVQGHLIIRQCWAIAFCMSLQQFVSSVFWNRYMQQYYTLLEVPHLASSQVTVYLESRAFTFRYCLSQSSTVLFGMRPQLLTITLD